MDESQNKKVEPKMEPQQQKKGGKNDKGQEKKRCHNCGIIGHLRKDCKKKKKKTGCFQCSEAGHLINDCSKRQGQGQRT